MNIKITSLLFILLFSTILLIPLQTYAAECCVCEILEMDLIDSEPATKSIEVYENIATENLCTEKIKELSKTAGYGRAISSKCSIQKNDKCITTAPSMTSLEDEFKLKNIVLGVTIPSLRFTPPPTEISTDGQIYIPWIGEYIKAIYNFGMIAISIIAVIVLILQGMKVIMSAGGSAKGEAYKRITQTIVGLFIAWGSFIVLYSINPNLTTFKSLKIKYIQPQGIDLDNYVKSDWQEPQWEGTGGSKKINNTTFDALFKDFASCFNLDWRILKGIAYKESTLNPLSVNSIGFTGLFQTKKSNCEGALKRYPLWADKCGNLTNPSVNTAVGTVMAKNTLGIINKRCKSASLRDKLALIYLGHNSGAGAVKYAIKSENGGGCTEALIKQGTSNFWEYHCKRTKRLHGNKVCINPSSTGNKRIHYSYKTADTILGLGASSIYKTGSGTTCPLTGVPSDNTASLSACRILAVGDSITADNKSYANKIDVTKKIAIKSKETGWMLAEVKKIDLSTYSHITVLGGVNDIAGGKSLNSIKLRLTQIYKAAREKNVKIVGITLNAWRYPSWTEKRQATTEKLNEWIRNKADGNIDYIIDFYSLTKDSGDPPKLKSQYDSGDGLHPSTAAHTVLADEITKVLSSQCSGQ